MSDITDSRRTNHRGKALAESESVVVVAIAGTDANTFEQIVKELPASRGMAFIVIAAGGASQQLSKEQLQQLTTLPVAEVERGLELRANRVYLVRPGQLVTCRGLELQVADAPPPQALLIDHLLRSLAEQHAERAAAILLSGIKGDGALGAVELKAAGGLVIVQAPASAAERGLPERQLVEKSADLLLPLSSLLNGLVHYFEPVWAEPDPAAWSAPFDAGALLPILSVLGKATGHDFSRYKRSTVSRRIQRRMRVHGLKDPAEYVEALKARPVEAELLFNEMLIGVTSFFRDPSTYLALEKALEQYLERLPQSHDVRVWVPACSTGEEAYSVAILLHECLQRSGNGRSVKVFATDVDPRAIEFARAGRYPRGIAAYVSPERLARFFVHEEEAYRINKETRECIVFAPHNVTHDPPFTHIDLLTCRNLLIYLESELQQQVLALFEYGLKPSGLLMLGASESLGNLQNSFDLIDKKAKLFMHRATHQRRGLALPIDPLWGERVSRHEERSVPRTGPRQSPISVTEQILLAELVPPSAIVAPSGELAYIHGRTGRFLEPPVGEPSNNIFDMAREGLRLELPAAVRAAHHAQQVIVRRGLSVRTNGSFESVTLTVKPLKEPDSLRGLLLLTFELDAQGGEPMSSIASIEPDQTSSLEAELTYVRSTLQGMIEDLESSNEELKSMNEELQSTNEEVQSSNEELSTSREELQSLNEELQTLNEELAQRNYMLSQSNDDMHNLLSSVHVATVFVDAQLNVKRFTAPAKKVFHLRDSDIGRPVSDLVVNLDYGTLVEDAQEVLRTLVFVEREVHTMDGEWRLMRILPYRTANNVIDGLIITVTDIQRLKQAQQHSEQASTLLEDVLANLPLPAVLLDESFRIVEFSLDFARRFGAAEPALIGKPLFTLGAGWSHTAVRQRLEALSKGEPCPSFRLQGTLGTSFPLDVLVQPRRLRGTHAAARYLLLFQEIPSQLPAPINVD